MSKVYLFLRFFSLLFLSTFFVGCKPQEEPIISLDGDVRQSTKIVERTVEEPEILPEENQIVKENERLVIVNVTAGGEPVTNATVTLTAGKFIEKHTDINGVAKFSVKKNCRFIILSAYNDDYAVETYSEILAPSPDLSPTVIDLILKEKGVIITAILIDKPEKIDDFRAAIIEADPQGMPKISVSTTNITKNKVVFHPIPSNFKSLQVIVYGENIPQCYSKEFCTTDGKDKEVTVEIPINVTLKGIALLPDGSPVTGKFYISVNSSDRTGGKYQAGKVSSRQIQPETDGSYKYSSLAQGFFDVTFALLDEKNMFPVYKNFETNLCLTAPETELNFSFSELPKLGLRGKVINGFDKEPIEGVTVYARQWRNLPAYDEDITDSEGKFSLELKSGNPDDFFGEITIDEPGFGRFKDQIHSKGTFATITIPLWPAGHITGKITDPHGNLLSGLVVEADNDNYIPSSCYDNLEYHSPPSDINGVYVISNVAAPMKYGISINKYGSHKQQNFTIPGNTFSVKVEPGEMAICDLVAISQPEILIKARDEKNNPVLKYTLDYKAQTKSRWCEFTFNVNLFDDDWFHLDSNINGAGTFSCSAYSIEKSLAVKTNNISFSGGTNYIVLIMTPSDVELNLSGYLTGVDGLPVKDGWIIVSSSSGNRKKGYTDDNGFFKIEGLEVKKGETLRVQMINEKSSYSSFTNILAGSENVELKITKPKEIIGQVFYDNLENPASNFTVKCDSFYRRQSFSSTDGKFLFKYNIRSRSKRYYSGNVIISSENYFPTETKFDLRKKSVYDVGNVILKSGKTANVKGKLVNQYGKPVEHRVYLKYKEKDNKSSALANLEDGVFVFEGLLPGKATISAKTWHGFTASYSFDIYEGDNLELPDLVLNYTNSAFVVMTFKLPDGSAVKNANIINNGYRIYATGVLSRDIHTGIYSDWKIKYLGKTYIADEFEITEDTNKLEVKLRKSPE